MTKELKEEIVDYEFDFDDNDDMGNDNLSKPQVSEESETICVERTTKEGIREVQDIMLAVIKKELKEQAKLGVYDTKLMKIVMDLTRQHDVPLDDKGVEEVQDAFNRIRSASKAHINKHKKDSQTTILN